MTAPVLIDPGHGGHDPGAVGPHGLREKDVNLAVARLVARNLASRAILTRENDSFLDLSARARRSNEAGASCFVSIHCNAFTEPSANGVETWAFSAGSGGAKLAGAVQPRLVSALAPIRDRGVKFAGFAVLRETRAPAALVELAFISNPAEEERLADLEFQTRAAEAIVLAIEAFTGEAQREA